jgi:hypothetical protein
MSDAVTYTGAIVVALLGGYQLWAYFHRRSVRRITPEQLRARLDCGENLTLVDLRKWEDILSSGQKLPKAQVRSAAELLRDRAAGLLPGDLVLYCS